MPSKRLAAVLLTAGITGGGVAGLVLGTPALGLAQSTTSTTTADAPPGTPAAGDRVLRHRGGARLETAAAALGVTADELRTALEGGKSIADVAKEKGVDLQKVIDALVADGTTKLDEAKATLPERVTEMVNRAGAFGPGGPGERGEPGEPGGHGRGGPGGPGGRSGGRGVIARLDVAATALGMTADELQDAVHEGKSLATIAGEKNVPVQKVIDALVTEANTHIDEQVTAGKLTAEQAATRKAEVVERITEMVNTARPARPTPPAGG